MTLPAPPAIQLPAAFATQGYRFRPAVPEDLEFERALYATSRPDAFVFDAWPEQMRRDFYEQQFRFQSMQYRMAYPGAVRLILQAHAERIGRLIYEPGETYWHGIDLALLPAWRGKGLGAAVMQALVDGTAAAGAPFMRLNVDRTNPAQKLYARIGFVVTEEGFPSLTMEWRPPARAS